MKTIGILKDQFLVGAATITNTRVLRLSPPSAWFFLTIYRRNLHASVAQLLLLSVMAWLPISSGVLAVVACQQRGSCSGRSATTVQVQAVVLGEGGNAI